MMRNTGALKIGVYLILIVVAGALAINVVAQSILPLAIAIIETNIYVKTEAGSGINNARVDCYQHDWLGGVPSSPSYTIYTGISGLASRTIAQGIYTIIVTATGYETKSSVVDLRVSGEPNPKRTITITLVPGGVSPTGHQVDFYLVGHNDERVSAYVTIGSDTRTSDEHGLARFTLQTGSYSVRFHGYYLEDTGAGLPIQRSFDFTKGVSVTKPDIFTIYLETESIINGVPPSEEADWDLTALVDFLMDSTIPGVPNWAIVAVLLFLILRR